MLIFDYRSSTDPDLWVLLSSLTFRMTLKDVVDIDFLALSSKWTLSERISNNHHS